MKNTFYCLAAVFAVALGADNANAGLIAVTGYTYGSGLDGDFSATYEDPSNTKLTDGIVGTPNVLDGTWVGWYVFDGGPPQITFSFGSVVTIGNVDLNFLREDIATTEVPPSVIIGGTTFPTTGFTTDNTEGFIDYAGSWTGSSLTVTLNFNPSGFIFLNEAEFSAPSAPEPASAAMLFGGLAGLMALKRRHSARSQAK